MGYLVESSMYQWRSLNNQSFVLVCKLYLYEVTGVFNNLSILVDASHCTPLTYISGLHWKAFRHTLEDPFNTLLPHTEGTHSSGTNAIMSALNPLIQVLIEGLREVQLIRCTRGMPPRKKSTICICISLFHCTLAAAASCVLYDYSKVNVYNPNK